MDEEKIIKDAIHYIRTHMPQETDFKTIDVAISTVARGCNAAASEDMVNRDDAWLIPDEERGKLAGIRGRGWVQGFDKKTISMFYEAVQYSKAHASEFEKTGGVSIEYDDIKKLKQMRNELMNNMPYDNSHSNIDDKNDYDKYISDYNDVNKIVK